MHGTRTTLAACYLGRLAPEQPEHSRVVLQLQHRASAHGEHCTQTPISLTPESVLQCPTSQRLPLLRRLNVECVHSSHTVLGSMHDHLNPDAHSPLKYVSCL